MIKIVKIKELRNQQVSMILDVNGTIIPHKTTIHLVMKYHLEEGKIVSEEEYKTFIVANEFELLYTSAIQFISYQMRTISEVKKHLRKDTKDETIIQNIITQLKKNQYLSDNNYVQEYVDEKIAYDLVGPKYIKDKLVQKGIHYDLIDAQLIRFTEDMEFDKVMEIIRKEIAYKQQKPYQKVIQSLKRKCINKGFQLGIIESAIISLKEEILEVIDEDELLDKELYKLQKQYDITNYEERQKIMQKLVARGYSYDAVKRRIK